MIIILGNSITEGEGQLMSLLIDQIFGRIKPITHKTQYTDRMQFRS
jgi:hypothetical protein